MALIVHKETDSVKKGNEDVEELQWSCSRLLNALGELFLLNHDFSYELCLDLGVGLTIALTTVR